MRRRLLPICLVLALLAPAWAEEPVLKIFQLNNRPAEATVELVRPLLSAEGSVNAETRLNKLIVRDTPERLEEVRVLLEEIDQPAPQVRIFVQTNGFRPVSGHRAVVGVSGNVRRPRVTGQAVQYEGSSSSSSTSNMLVMSGERGVIRVADSVPVFDPYTALLTSYGLMPPGVVFQELGTGFAVYPTVIGKTVRLRIAPWLGYRAAEGTGQVVIEEASTTIVLESGESAVIGSSTSNEESVQRSFGTIFGSVGQNAARSASFTVRPEIQPDYQ